MVQYFIVIILIELKRALSPFHVALHNALPFFQRGSTIIQKHLNKAQKQGLNQASLYLCTPASQLQAEIMVVTAAGPNFTYTVLECRDRESFVARLWQPIELCTTMDTREQERVVERLNLPSGRPDTNIHYAQLPKPLSEGDLKWSGLEIGGVKFANRCPRFLKCFEAKLKTCFLDAFNFTFVQWLPNYFELYIILILNLSSAWHMTLHAMKALASL